MAWIAPKLDWTNANFMNPEDFNRIENNIKEVRDYLNSIQYSIPALTIKTDRDYTYIPFLSDINRIEQNLESIRNNFMTPVGYGAAETWTVGKGFDFNDAIRLENNVRLLLDTGVLVYQSLMYCGTFKSGESGGLY